MTPPVLLHAAARGECDRLSVIQQLSSECCNGLSPYLSSDTDRGYQQTAMPSWMYTGGMSLSDVPTNPYIPTPKGHKQYEEGKALVDPTCETMARHIGRVVGW